MKVKLHGPNWYTMRFDFQVYAIWLLGLCPYFLLKYKVFWLSGPCNLTFRSLYGFSIDIHGNLIFTSMRFDFQVHIWIFYWYTRRFDFQVYAIWLTGPCIYFLLKYKVIWFSSPCNLTFRSLYGFSIDKEGNLIFRSIPFDF
jgi:hypothetical protein